MIELDSFGGVCLKALRCNDLYRAPFLKELCIGLVLQFDQHSVFLRFKAGLQSGKRAADKGIAGKSEEDKQGEHGEIAACATDSAVWKNGEELILIDS